MAPSQERESSSDAAGLLSLRIGQAQPEVIDARIRDGIRLAGTPLWVLVCAILIASIGLNVNSPAVIIGAMLISPLMGPIIGVGYGAGIEDAQLVRASVRNLLVFVAISVVASTAYFLVSPLREAHSELLARSTPTIWDVLVALFGGAAGMVGLSRKESSNVIPGVAIATALMPPLCTASFGLAAGQMEFVLGGSYLFAINAVYIAIAAFAVARLIDSPKPNRSDPRARLRGNLAIGTVAILTGLPSLYLAFEMVQRELFEAQANRYLSAIESSEKGVLVVTRDIDPRARRISIGTVGGPVAPELQKKLESRLGDFGLKDAQLELRRASDVPHVDTSVSKVSAKQANIAREQLMQLRAFELDAAQVEKEIRAQLPALRQATVTWAAPSDANARRVIVILDAPQPIPADEVSRLKRWLAVRVPAHVIEVVFSQPMT